MAVVLAPGGVGGVDRWMAVVDWSGAAPEIPNGLINTSGIIANVALQCVKEFKELGKKILSSAAGGNRCGGVHAA